MDTVNVIQAGSLGALADLKPVWIQRLRNAATLIDTSRGEEAKINLFKTIDEMVSLDSKTDKTSVPKQASAFLLEFGNTWYAFQLAVSLVSRHFPIFKIFQKF